jgi:hypothetical protein
MNDLKNRGLSRHRELLLWLALILCCTGSFAFGVALGMHL